MNPSPTYQSIPLKRIGKFQNGSGFPNDEQGLADQEVPFLKVSDMNLKGNEHFIQKWNNSVSRKTASKLGARLIPPGAIIYAKIGAALFLNKRRILQRNSCIDNNMMAFVGSDCDTKWIFYWFNTIDFATFANPGAVPSLNEKGLREFAVDVPNLTVQRKVGSFLDRKTHQIDALIAKKQRQIELLKEKRSALITQAVTKGLDPSVKMKDSGVEWLSEIPEHWDHQALKRVASLVGRIGFRGYSTDDIVDEGEGAITLSPRNMVQGKLSLDDCTYVSWEKYNESPEIQIFINDILLVKTGSTYGKVAYVGIAPMEMTVNPQIMVLKEIKANPRYLYYAVTSRPFHGLLRLLNTGSTIPTMTQEGVGRIHVPMPGRDEQDGIVEYLDSHSEKIDVLIERITKSISLLDEHRSSLISEAVTGKLPIGETS